MATIKFLPPPLNTDGTIDYNHPNLNGKNGVYIVGVKININRPPQFDKLRDIISDKIDRFLPLYVGKS